MKRLLEKILSVEIARIPIFIWGLPGVGKRGIVQDICEDMGLGLDVWPAPTPIDLGSPPKSHGEFVLYSPSRPLPVEGKGVLLITDFNLFITEKDNVSYELFASRSIHGRAIGEGWRIVVTGIPPYYGGDAHPLQVNLIPLFLHLGKDSDISFLDRQRSIDVSSPTENDFFKDRSRGVVKRFLSQKPSLWHEGRATPRAWYYLSSILDHVNLGEEEVPVVACGLLGEGVASEFIAFLFNSS